MTTYIIRRLIQSMIVVILVTMGIFLLMRQLPGDPVLMYVSMDDISGITSDEELAALRHEFGLDKPIYEQYKDWISALVRGVEPYPHSKGRALLNLSSEGRGCAVAMTRYLLVGLPEAHRTTSPTPKYSSRALRFV